MSSNKSCRSLLYVKELINILITPALILFITMEDKFYFLPYSVAYSITFIISYNNIKLSKFSLNIDCIIIILGIAEVEVQ